MISKLNANYSENVSNWFHSSFTPLMEKQREFKSPDDEKSSSNVFLNNFN